MGMTLHEAPAPTDIKSCYTVILDGRVIGRVDMDLAPSLVNRLRMLKVLGQEKVHRGCFTIYRKFPENPVEKKMEHDFLGRSGGKFPGATKHLKG